MRGGINSSQKRYEGLVNTEEKITSRVIKDMEMETTRKGCFSPPELAKLAKG